MTKQKRTDAELLQQALATGKPAFGEVKNGLGPYWLPSGEKKWRYVQKAPNSRKTITKGGFHTKTAAKNALRELNNALHDGTHVSAGRQRETFGPFAEDWFRKYQLGIGTRRRPRPTTVARYDSVLRNHILPHWRNTQWREFDLDEIEKWLAYLSTKPARSKSGRLEQATIIKCYRLLAMICASAVRHRYLPGNPCTVTFEKQRPDTQKYEEISDPNLVRKLADHMRDEVWWDERHHRHHRRHAKYRALVLLAGFVGTRWGEAIALRRRDINLTNGTVRIRRQVILLPGQPPQVVTYTKSEAGLRTVDLPTEVCEALRHHLDHHVDDPGPDALLWTSRTRNGSRGHLRGPNFRRDVWLPAVRAQGLGDELDDLVFHDLRHAAGTIAASTGAPIKDLMQRLGHATETAALRYQHSTKETQKALAARIDAALSLTFPAEAATGTTNVVPIRRHD